MNNPGFPKAFQTPEYAGIWLDFKEDRMAFRATIETYLRETMKDPRGVLEVLADGPHWKSDLPLELSYSHTKGTGVLVYSTTHALGVDIESESREFYADPLQIAARFFPPIEWKQLEQLSKLEQQTEFLKLWVQKEAYAKLTRLGLAKTLELGIIPAEHLQPKPLLVAPQGFFSCVVLKKLELA